MSGGQAIFTGTGGTVTLSSQSAITAGSITFSATGSYLLTGGTLNAIGLTLFANSDATFTTSSIAVSVQTSKSGSGTVTISGPGTFNPGNTLIVNFGTLAFTGGRIRA